MPESLPFSFPTVPVAALLAALAATAVAVAVAARSGWRGARRRHLAQVAVAATLFVCSVVLAELLGSQCAFDGTARAVHLAFAHAATAALVGTAASGAVRLRHAGAANVHRTCALAFLVLLVGAVGTGAWMLSTARPRPPAEAGPVPAAGAWTAVQAGFHDRGAVRTAPATRGDDHEEKQGRPR